MPEAALRRRATPASRHAAERIDLAQPPSAAAVVLMVDGLRNRCFALRQFLARYLVEIGLALGIVLVVVLTLRSLS
jgi:hypothetical protein